MNNSVDWVIASASLINVIIVGILAWITGKYEQAT
jgi:hypothetical protein